MYENGMHARCRQFWRAPDATERTVDRGGTRSGARQKRLAPPTEQFGARGRDSPGIITIVTYFHTEPRSHIEP